MSGRCAVLRNKKEREKEERSRKKKDMEQIGEKRGEARKGEKIETAWLLDFPRSGIYFFCFLGKGHKAQKSRDVFIL